VTTIPPIWSDRSILRLQQDDRWRALRCALVGGGNLRQSTL
jgi:hypothetical protein